MRKIATLAVVFTLVSGAIAEEVKLRYTRPSTLITIFAEARPTPGSRFAGNSFSFAIENKVVIGRLKGFEGGIIPEGVTLVAHDSKGILDVTGPDEKVKEVRRYIELFDVQPRRLSLEVDMSCPILNAEATSKSTLHNNRVWEAKDETMALKLAVAARINDDGTITLSVQGSRTMGEKVSIVARVKPGEELRLSFGKTVMYAIGSNSMSEGSSKPAMGDSKAEGDINDPEVLVRIKAQPLDLIETKKS